LRKKRAAKYRPIDFSFILHLYIYGMKSVYKVQQDHIEFLRAEHGKLFDKCADAIKKITRPVVSIGDRVSANLLKENFNPDIIIHDNIERRKEIDQEQFDLIYGFVAEELVAKNPKGEITQQLWDAVQLALKQMPKRIRVIGEEDLSALAVMALAPVGSTIIYGLNGKMLVMKLDERIQKQAKKIMGLK